MSLDALLQTGSLWRAGSGNVRRRDSREGGVDSVPTGFAGLDALLAGGGWPVGTLTEILCPREDSRALSLVLPALARLSQQHRWLAWVGPPHIPYAPALAAAGVDISRVLLVHPGDRSDALWAVEQALRSGTCGAVLGWLEAGDHKTLRRLQLAAEAGHAWGILFRPARAAQQSSPAALRLQLAPTANGVDVHVLKRRGGWPTGPVQLDMDLG